LIAHTLEGKKPMEVITSGSWLIAKAWEVALGGGCKPWRRGAWNSDCVANFMRVAGIERFNGPSRMRDIPRRVNPKGGSGMK
jgi:hypothetical protein